MLGKIATESSEPWKPWRPWRLKSSNPWKRVPFLLLANRGDTRYFRKTDETLRDRLVKRKPRKLSDQRELLCVAEDGAEYKTKGE